MDPIAPIPPHEPQPARIARVARVRRTDRDGRRDDDGRSPGRHGAARSTAPDVDVAGDEPSDDGRPHVDLTA